MKVKELLSDGSRELVEIPPGSWGVILTMQVYQGEDILDDGDYVRPYKGSCGTVRLSEHYEGDYLRIRELYWSDNPFVMLKTWMYPLDGCWAHPATRINKHGLTQQLPALPAVQWIMSHAGEFGREDQPRKWVSLIELARAANMQPRKILEEHHGHLNDLSQGMYVIHAASKADAQNTLKFETVWTVPDIEKLFTWDPETIYVSKTFATLVLYCAMIDAREAELKAG